MKRILAVVFLCATAAVARGQTATPTPTPTNTPTPTFTTTQTPTPARLGPCIILGVPNGAAISNEIDFGQGAYSISVFAPATLAETVSFDTTDTFASTTWTTLQNPVGTDVTVAAGKQVNITDLTIGKLRVKLNGNAAAARSFRVCGVQTWR